MRAAAGLEDAPEGGSRCERCFRLRLKTRGGLCPRERIPFCHHAYGKPP
ncbi:MAG: hypothetical protein ACLTY5_07835 [Angelakisella sp.]